MTKLNLGAGRYYLDGYKNIDISKENRADEYYDLTKGIKEKDGIIDEINCGCMMEQIDLNKDFIFFLNECHRVLRDGGSMKGYVPSTDERVINLDPMDRRFFQIDSFKYFNKNEHHWQEFGRTYGLRGWSEHKAEIADNGIIFFELKK